MGKQADRAARESRLASGWTVEGEDHQAPLSGNENAVDGAIADPQSNDAARPQQFSAAMLVVLGILGGIYLLYSMVWLSWAKAYTDAKHLEWAASMGSLGDVLQTVLFFLAAFAPVLWFVTALVSHGRGRTRRLLLWLVLGVLLLVPLPMFSGGN